MKVAIFSVLSGSKDTLYRIQKGIKTTMTRTCSNWSFEGWYKKWEAFILKRSLMSIGFHDYQVDHYNESSQLQLSKWRFSTLTIFKIHLRDLIQEKVELLAIHLHQNYTLFIHPKGAILLKSNQDLKAFWAGAMDPKCGLFTLEIVVKRVSWLYKKE